MPAPPTSPVIPTAVSTGARTRARLTLLLIAVLFAAPFVVALCLYYAKWQPTHTRNYGELIQPVRDLRAVRFTRADGNRFEWHHEDHMWRVLVVPPADCAAACDQLADKLRRIWIGLGSNADGVQVLWVGAAPRQEFRALMPVGADPALAAQLPDRAHSDAIPVYVVDPSGYLFLRYAPGFNPADLRRDLAQLMGAGTNQ